MSGPEQQIRDYLEKHGPVELLYESLELSWREGALDRRRRREVATDLERAGVRVEPPMEQARAGDTVRVSLAPGRDGGRSLGWLVAVPLALMAAGALGPWAQDVFATEQGIDGNGWIVLAAGAAGTVLLALQETRQRPTALPIAAALAGAVAAAIVARDFRDFLDDALVSPAWGLYVSFAGAALLVMISMATIVRR